MLAWWAWVSGMLVWCESCGGSWGGAGRRGGGTDEGGQGHHDEGRTGRQHVKQQGGRATVDMATSHTLNMNKVGREGLSLKPVEC